VTSLFRRFLLVLPVFFNWSLSFERLLLQSSI